MDGFVAMPWSGDSSDDRRFGQYGQSPAHPIRPPRVSVKELEARIRRYNSDLEPNSPTFRSAVILLAGLEYGQNIDLLARKTGYDRSFVARVARRLIDNGIWKAGATIADWTSSDEASGTFWSDVAVAEGKMCRRIGADGRPEWAPAGFWNKSFQFVDPGADQRLATLYLDPNANPPSDAADELVSSEAERTSAESVQPVAMDADNDEAETDEDTVIIGPPSAPAKPTEEERKGPVPRLDDLFGDVVWIG